MEDTLARKAHFDAAAERFGNVPDRKKSRPGGEDSTDEIKWTQPVAIAR